MKRAILTLLLLTFASSASRAVTLEEGFLSPPEATKPSCYWYWISDNISKEGITRDLEGMQRVGIGEAFIGNIYLDDTLKGNVKALTEEWWSLVEHAIREGGRIGVKVGLFNCPGWSQSGGPWIKTTQAMRYVTMTEQKVTGPSEFTGKIPAPTKDFQDIAVLAFAAPPGDAAILKPSIKSTLPNAEKLVDGDTNSVVAMPSTGMTAMDLEFATPVTARSLTLVPQRKDFIMDCEMFAERNGSLVSLQKFTIDRSNNGLHVGFVPYAPVAISFDPVTTTRFQLRFSKVRQNAGLAEIQLSPSPQIERYIEKQLGKMHPTPIPMWGDYLWPASSEPVAKEMLLAPETVRDLTGKLQSDGTLKWSVPPGEWVIVRFGMSPTGTKNSPASPEGQGYEVDKMNREAAQAHFDAYIGKLLSRFKTKEERKAWERVIADSYEMGAQNWTDGLRERFQKHYGYDPRTWLPCLTGRVVGSADQSDRFLWDLRRFVADEIAYNYVGGLRDACHKHGLRLWLENYGHWGFPAEFLQYGGQSDDLGGEFWTSGGLGSVELRAASSAVHIYGKSRVSAEAFTSGSKFESTPWSLKKRGDWAMTQGINHWVLHVNIHQPWEDKLPGVNAWFSTEFNRHNPWFFPGREFVDYYRRCHFLLQQGKHVADVAYFIGEATPKMTGIQHPPLPPGYNYDYINAEVILNHLTVRDGRFLLPDGMSYAVLALPPEETMRPDLLAKIVSLVKAGGTIVGNPPKHSPSMQNYPKADRKVASLAAELWTDCDGEKIRSRRFGKGRVYRNTGLEEIFKDLDIQPQISGCDFSKVSWTQRKTSDAEIFFLSNQSDAPLSLTPGFRVRGKAPELWNASSKCISLPAIFSTASGKVAFDMEPRGSLFVVFRSPADAAQQVAALMKDGQAISALPENTSRSGQTAATPNTVNNFAIAAWVLPKTDIALPGQADSGVFTAERRNELVTAPHGASMFGGPEHACAGVSVGKNGVVVYEHSDNYFAPLLSYAVEIPGWTHLTVVYKQGRPSLYINGKMAHEGLQSKYTVHSGLAADPNASAAFNGKVSGIESFSGSLEASLILKLAQAPRTDASGPPTARLTRTARGGVLADIADPGEYVVRFADGREYKVAAHSIPAPRPIVGTWKVAFPSGRDVPTSIEMEELVSLTEHSHPAIRHFSGTTTYSKTFEMEPVTGNTRVILDLGEVAGVAELALNGQPLGVLWMPPFQKDVTTIIRPGRNELSVCVSGTWLNRLIGDAKYPNGFPGENGEIKALEFKPFLTANLKLTGKEPLQPFGLLGPVMVRQIQQTPVK